MSKPEAAHDAVDEAYLDAEALLDDGAARAARRARVLAAAADARPTAPSTAAPARRTGWRYGGWAAAAVLVVTVAAVGRMRLILPHPPSPTPSAPAEALRPSARAAREAASRQAAPPVAMKEAPAGSPVSGADDEPRPARREVDHAPAANLAPPPPLPLPLPPVKAPLSEASAAASQQASVLPHPAPPPPLVAAPAPVTREPDAGRGALLSGESADRPAAPRARAAAAKASNPGGQLRAAAAAGSIAEIEALLDGGAPVDDADADGDTALMESVRVGRPAVAALLRRRGADPNRRNAAGLSPAAVAALKSDPALTAALAPPR